MAADHRNQLLTKVFFRMRDAGRSLEPFLTEVVVASFDTNESPSVFLKLVDYRRTVRNSLLKSTSLIIHTGVYFFKENA